MFVIGKYLAIAAAVALALCFGVIWYQHGEIGALREDIATERAKTAVQAKTIATLEHQRAEDQRQIGALGERANKAQQEKDDVVAKFNSYRDRLGKAAMARPSLVGRLASRSVLSVMRDFERASGGGDNDAKDRPAAPGADKPAADQDRGSDAGRDAGAK